MHAAGWEAVPTSEETRGRIALLSGTLETLRDPLPIFNSFISSLGETREDSMTPNNARDLHMSSYLRYSCTAPLPGKNSPDPCGT